MAAFGTQGRACRQRVQGRALAFLSLALLPRTREPDQFGTDGMGVGDGFGPGDAADGVSACEVAAIDIDGDHSPAAGGAGEEGDGVGVVGVAVGHDALGGFGDTSDGLGVRQKVNLAEAVGAGEAGDVEGLGGADAPEGEVGEVGVLGSVGVDGEPAGFEFRVGVGLGEAGDGDAGGGLRVWAVRGAGDVEGAAWVGLEVSCVLGEGGEPEQEAEVGGGRGGDEGGEGLAGVNGREGAGAGGAQELAGLEGGGGFDHWIAL